MLKAYKNLSPKARLGVGFGIIGWGVAGLYLSDRAEEKFGFTPTPQDKDELNRMVPKVVAVDKKELRT